MLKLNSLLAITEDLAGSFKGMVKDFIDFFKKNQSSFQGEKNTYTAFEGQEDFPSLRKSKVVVTTVDEKLRWFNQNTSKYINGVLDQEATNASGNAATDLIVDGQNWGRVSTNEILRMLNILQNFNLKEMYGNIPVRSDSENWFKTSNEDDDYIGREIYQTELLKYPKRTSETEQYVLSEANQYNPNPVIASRKIVIEQGIQTNQKFSGEWSHRQRANSLLKLEKLRTALKEALSRANDVEVVQSNVRASQIFDYIHNQ